MSSRKINNNNSSSSEDSGAILDEKRRKRMQSNRESARRSRLKREQHIQDLNDQVTYYRIRNREIDKKCNDMMDWYVGVESENMRLRMQGEELKKWLVLLEEIVVSDKNMNHESSSSDFIQELLVEPWLQSHSSDGIYQF